MILFQLLRTMYRNTKVIPFYHRSRFLPLRNTLPRDILNKEGRFGTECLKVVCMLLKDTKLKGTCFQFPWLFFEPSVLSWCYSDFLAWMCACVCVSA